MKQIHNLIALFIVKMSSPLKFWGGYPEVVSSCEDAPTSEQECKGEYTHLSVLFRIMNVSSLEQLKTIISSLSVEEINRINSPVLDAVIVLLNGAAFQRIEELYSDPSTGIIRMNELPRYKKGDLKNYRDENLNAFRFLAEFEWTFTLDHLLFAYVQRQPKLVAFLKNLVSPKYHLRVSKTIKKRYGPRNFILEWNREEEIESQNRRGDDERDDESTDERDEIDLYMNKHVVESMNIALWELALTRPDRTPLWGDLVTVIFGVNEFLYHDGIGLVGYSTGADQEDRCVSTPSDFQVLVRHPQNPELIIEPKYWLEKAIELPRQNTLIWLNYLPYIEEMKKNVCFVDGESEYSYAVRTVATWFEYKIPASQEFKEETRTVMICFANEDCEIFPHHSRAIREKLLMKGMEKFLKDDDLQPLSTSNEFGVTVDKVDHVFYINNNNFYRNLVQKLGYQ